MSMMVAETKTGYSIVQFLDLTHEVPRLGHVTNLYIDGSATQPVSDLTGARRS